MVEKDASMYRAVLEKSEVTPMVREALLKLLANRPENPILFLRDHFKSYVNVESRNRTQQAVELILLTSYLKPVFERNLMTAFDSLTNAKSSGSSGITGVAFQEVINEVLTSYCTSRSLTDGHGNAVEQLQKKLAVRDHEVVNFAIFRSSVYLTLIFVDYLCLSIQLFRELDCNNQGRIPLRNAESILSYFKETLDATAESETLKMLSSAAQFTAKNIAPLLEADESVSHVTIKYISEGDFMSQAASAFLSKVQNIQ